MLELVWSWMLVSDWTPGDVLVPRSPGQMEVGQEPTTTTEQPADQYKPRPCRLLVAENWRTLVHTSTAYEKRKSTRTNKL